MEENLIIDIIPKFMYRNKCKSFIILNDKKEILKYDSSHNHPKKEYDVSLSIMKHKIKNGIEKSSIPFGIKIKPLYNKISKEMRFICPEYNSIKSQISRNLNKKLPSNLTTFTEIPNKSKYYKPKRVKLIEAKLINAKWDRNNTINLWFDCLTDLNNIL
ncbi:hypothetical protein LY90DRAFT_506595 [Neocallimastix californiae]|uniref:FLYWCH-type domain-containing protein n=1 Tax=Neocallimastix californiae TaxID=1754190 RepID=A0A1Y2DCS6_9FUNG|nr:hypothetical protein LY90DRAFT_506595 [Neocallimastix californiae]|eukprot:ORY57059.1 hypothetical protein LY90DRAFT_506595 [Neocallimastix californiae]